MQENGHDDLSYLLEVLEMTDGETEAQLDEKLRAEAKHLGINVEAQLHSGVDPPLSNKPPGTPRRSDSVESRASQSTDLASNLSEQSRELLHSTRHSRRSRASLSFRDYDAFLARGVPDGRHSISFSPISASSRSSFSLPLSQPPSPASSPKRHFRRLRGLSMLKLHRIDSRFSNAEFCPHCPGDLASQRRAVHKLPCGHRLCTQALRNSVMTAIESSSGAVPSCCATPIPGSIVEQVMTQTEQGLLLDKLEQWDEVASLAPSTESGPRDSTASRPLGLRASGSRPVSEQSRTDSFDPKATRKINRAMERSDYQILVSSQSKERDRFMSWAERRRATIAASHETKRTEMQTAHQGAFDGLFDQHISAMSEAEDKQVKAEADMREMQEQEWRDLATALKHMEAYCAGTYSTGELHNRIVTDQDRAELDKTRRTRDQMNSKHKSSINVLRGEQSRRIRLRSQRQEKELQELKRQQRAEELELERTCTRETNHLDESVAEKRNRVRLRWELQVAIFAKQVEAETGAPLECALPTAEWPTSPRHGSDATQILEHKSSPLITNGFTVHSSDI